jgi:hypothetical protein
MDKKLSMKQETKEGDWFDMYDDLNKCLNEAISTNRSSHLATNNHKAAELFLESKEEKNEERQCQQSESKKIDYYKWEPQTQLEDLENSEEYAHIIEIYDFPSEFKNEHIFNAFKELIGNQEFDLKWVDDTHCLGVFSSASVATTALNSNNNNIFLKTRPLAKATIESKKKAQRIVNYLRPYKPRPQTTSFVASKLIGASLGLNNLIPKEKLKLEKNKLDNARSQKHRDKEIREAVWNGNV